MSALDELWGVVNSVPEGRVAGYGDVGRALSTPVSGLLVGKWMAQCPPTLPWWRIVGRNGDLLVGHRNPVLALEQRQRLESEGVEFDGELVSQSMFWIP